MSNSPCNCTANFEKLHEEMELMKSLLQSIHVMVSHHLIKKEDILEEKNCMNNESKHGVESSMDHDIPLSLLLLTKSF